MEFLSDPDSQCIVGGVGGMQRRGRQLIPLGLGLTPGPDRGRRGGGKSLFSQMTAVLNQINIVINIIYGDGMVSVSQMNAGMIDMSVLG